MFAWGFIFACLKEFEMNTHEPAGEGPTNKRDQGTHEYIYRMFRQRFIKTKHGILNKAGILCVVGKVE